MGTLPQDLRDIHISKIVTSSTADNSGLQGIMTNEYGEILGGDIFIDVDELKVVKIEDLISYVQSNKHVVDP
jgi:hypothetical protein